MNDTNKYFKGQSPRINFRLDISTKMRLDLFCEKSKKTISDVCKIAVKEYLERAEKNGQ